jgi:hypothetical protein
MNAILCTSFLIYRWRLNFNSSGADFSPAPVSVMKLDTTHLRYLSENDFRVLTAVDPLLDMGTNTKGGNRERKPSCRPHTLDHSNRQITLRKCCTLNKRACKGIDIKTAKCKIFVCLDVYSDFCVQTMDIDWVIVGMITLRWKPSRKRAWYTLLVHK